jgi:hypothetical protein
MIREFSNSIVEIVWSEKASFVARYKFSKLEEGWQCSKGGAYLHACGIAYRWQSKTSQLNTNYCHCGV